MISSRLTAVLVIAAAFALPGSHSFAAGPVEETAAVCTSCHGEQGVPIDNATPVIWGQKEGYIYLQLRDFQKGVRRHEQMQAVVADLKKEDIQALAAYFAAKPWPNLSQEEAPKQVADQAIAANVSVACTGCHLGEYQGDGTVPRLAGQWRAYLEKTMTEFRERTRGNNPGMSDLMNATPSEDIKALAHYLSGLRLTPGQ